MGIGTLQESSLHSAVKDWLARPGDQPEVLVDGFWVDLHCGDHIVEIQTRNFSAIKPKLQALLELFPVTLVYPIPQEKWIVRLEDDLETILSRRKSPRTGKLEDIFFELIRIPELLKSRNLVFKVLLTSQEEILCRTGAAPSNGRKTSWRRKGWKILDRKLLKVSGEREFGPVEDFLAFIPPSLPEEFTVRDLSTGLKISYVLARRMAYCLRKMGLIDVMGRKKQGYLYHRNPL